MPNPKPTAWSRPLGSLLGLFGLIIFLPALWHFLWGFWSANALIYQQGHSSSLVFVIQIFLSPLTLLLYPLYWLLAFGDYYFLIEQITLVLGWILFTHGLDLASYVVEAPVNTSDSEPK